MFGPSLLSGIAKQAADLQDSGRGVAMGGKEELPGMKRLWQVHLARVY